MPICDVCVRECYDAGKLSCDHVVCRTCGLSQSRCLVCADVGNEHRNKQREKMVGRLPNSDRHVTPPSTANSTHTDGSRHNVSDTASPEKVVSSDAEPPEMKISQKFPNGEKVVKPKAKGIKAEVEIEQVEKAVAVGKKRKRLPIEETEASPDTRKVPRKEPKLDFKAARKPQRKGLRMKLVRKTAAILRAPNKEATKNGKKGEGKETKELKRTTEKDAKKNVRKSVAKDAIKPSKDGSCKENSEALSSNDENVKTVYGPNAYDEVRLELRPIKRTPRLDRPALRTTGRVSVALLSRFLHKTLQLDAADRVILSCAEQDLTDPMTLNQLVNHVWPQSQGHMILDYRVANGTAGSRR